MIKQIAIVGLGGSVGSILRYLTVYFSAKLYTNTPVTFPYHTFAVNIIGCFIIGILMGLSERHLLINNDLKLLLVTGFCGGYTTFSAFSAENYQLYQNGHYITLLLYISGSVIAGLAAVYIGLIVTRP